MRDTFVHLVQDEYWFCGLLMLTLVVSVLAIYFNIEWAVYRSKRRKELRKQKKAKCDARHSARNKMVVDNALWNETYNFANFIRFFKGVSDSENDREENNS